MPEQEIIIRHICVEGWDYIGQWSGPNLRNFLQRVGADLTARYVYFICADDYTECIDMATALHPQTILATKYAGEVIGDPFGYPLRLRTSTKLGYKNAKWIMAIEVSNDFRETYWSERGFNWYAETVVDFAGTGCPLSALSGHQDDSMSAFGSQADIGALPENVCSLTACDAPYCPADRIACAVCVPLASAASTVPISRPAYNASPEKNTAPASSFGRAFCASGVFGVA